MINGNHRTAAIEGLLDASISQKIAPGFSVGIGDGEEFSTITSGNRTYAGSSEKLKGDELWDIASLTKVVATFPAAMRLFFQMKVDLEDRLGRYLGLVERTELAEIKIRHLLTHEAGFSGAIEFHKEAKSKNELIQLLLKQNVTYDPGTIRIYDDASYILLGLLIESLSGMTLDECARQLVFYPLGMLDTQFSPISAEEGARVIPTEIDRESGRIVCGTVHDENARVLGGAAGHAGLFSTVDDLGRYCRWFSGVMLGTDKSMDVGFSDFLARSVRQNTKTQNGVVYTLAWDVFDPRYSANTQSLWLTHTGFTGTPIYV